MRVYSFTLQMFPAGTFARTLYFVGLFDYGLLPSCTYPIRFDYTALQALLANKRHRGRLYTVIYTLHIHKKNFFHSILIYITQ